MSSALSYHPSASYHPPSSSYRSPAPYIETSCKPHTHGSYASSMNISSPGKNYVQEKKVPVAPSNLSYSAAAKKAGDVPQVLVLVQKKDVTFWQSFLRSPVFAQELQAWHWWVEREVMQRILRLSARSLQPLPQRLAFTSTIHRWKVCFLATCY